MKIEIVGKIKNLRVQFLLAAISGLLLVLAFPKIDMGWVAYIAIVPLLIAIRRATWQDGFWLGYTCGLVQNLGMLYWTAHTMHTYGHLPMPLAICVLLLFCVYLSIFTGLFGSAISYLAPSPFTLILLAPLAWVMSELLRGWLFSGFPWGLLGYSVYDHLWTIQIAELFGVYAISALIVMINAAVALAILHRLERTWHGATIRRQTVKICGAVTLGLFLIIIVYGIVRIHRIDTDMAAAPRKTVAVIQGNIDQAQKWDPRFQMLTTVKYRNLSLVPEVKSADLVIWPETATPFYLFDDPILTEMVLAGVKQANAHFIIGSPTYASGPQQTVYHNSAFLVTPQGGQAGQYDKVHLVPFGEYVPFKRWLPFIKKMVAQVGDFKPGRAGDTLAWDEHPVGMLICYEIIFPGLSRSMVSNGAQILVNITNDAWFGRTSAAYQHFSMAVLRAVENRRSIARAANTGISGFIDPNGRIVHATSLFTEAAVAAPVPLLQQHTAYTQWGNWPLGLTAFGVIAAAGILRGLRTGRWRRTRKGTGTETDSKG